jgi:hypothetical protein
MCNLMYRHICILGWLHLYHMHFIGKASLIYLHLYHLVLM